jgi:multiple sugar transport system ATP-binding protein
LGTTTVYVTHDQIEAMTMADRIVVMRDGRISQVGAPLDLYDRPINTFVAGFIGSPSMNLIAGEVAGDRFRAGGVDLPMPAGSGFAQGAKLTYGIRPEHLTLSDSGQPVTVVVVEPTGAEIHLVLRAGDVEMTAVVRERQAFQPGQTLHISPQAGMVHLFDAAGDRIA